jgi:hypothetical protein
MNKGRLVVFSQDIMVFRMMKLPRLSTRFSSNLSICMTAIGVTLLTTHAVHAASLSFQEGVSPSGSYTTGGVTIRSNVPTTNQDTVDQIIVGSYSNGTVLLRGLLEFDLTAIETAAGGSAFTIDSVSLVMHTDSESTSGSDPITFYLNLLGTNSVFDETTVTWDNAPTEAGGTIGTSLSSVEFTPTSTTNTDQTFASTGNFTTAVSEALATSANTISLILSTNVTAGDASSFARFVSDEASSLADRPELIVNYSLVPEPSSFALLLGGASLLVCFQRRRRIN